MQLKKKKTTKKNRAKNIPSGFLSKGQFIERSTDLNTSKYCEVIKSQWEEENLDRVFYLWVARNGEQNISDYVNCEKLFWIIMTIIFKVANNNKTFCNKYTGICCLDRVFLLVFNFQRLRVDLRLWLNIFVKDRVWYRHTLFIRTPDIISGWGQYYTGIFCNLSIVKWFKTSNVCLIGF